MSPTRILASARATVGASASRVRVQWAGLRVRRSRVGGSVGGVRHLYGQIRIARPVEVVFDFIADSRNEPRYNPDMRTVTLLTGEPIGPGTRFQAHMGRSGLQLLVTLTGFDRPHRLDSTTTSTLMDTTGGLRFTADGPSATVMSWDWQVQPKGWLRLLGPAFIPIGQRMERRIWTAARNALHTGADPGPDTPA